MERFGEEPVREPKGLKEFKESSLKINKFGEIERDEVKHTKEQQEKAQEMLNDLNEKSSRNSIEEKSKSFLKMLTDTLISKPEEKNNAEIKENKASEKEQDELIM